MEAEAKEREEKKRIKEERKRKREEEEKTNPSKPKAAKDGGTKKNKKLANCNILSAEDKMNAMMAKLMGGSTQWDIL